MLRPVCFHVHADKVKTNTNKVETHLCSHTRLYVHQLRSKFVLRLCFHLHFFIDLFDWVSMWKTNNSKIEMHYCC